MLKDFPLTQKILERLTCDHPIETIIGEGDLVHNGTGNSLASGSVLGHYKVTKCVKCGRTKTVETKYHS